MLLEFGSQVYRIGQGCPYKSTKGYAGNFDRDHIQCDTILGILAINCRYCNILLILIMILCYRCAIVVIYSIFKINNILNLEKIELKQTVGTTRIAPYGCAIHKLYHIHIAYCTIFSITYRYRWALLVTQ